LHNPSLRLLSSLYFVIRNIPSVATTMPRRLTALIFSFNISMETITIKIILPAVYIGYEMAKLIVFSALPRMKKLTAAKIIAA